MANSNYQLGGSGKLGIVFLLLVQILRLALVCTTFYLIYDSLIVKQTDSGLFDQASSSSSCGCNKDQYNENSNEIIENFNKVETPSTKNSSNESNGENNTENGYYYFYNEAASDSSSADEVRDDFTDLFGPIDKEEETPTLASTFSSSKEFDWLWTSSDVRYARIMDVFALLASTLDISMALLAVYTITTPLSRNVGFGRWVKWIFRSRLIWMRMLWVATAIIYAVLYVRYRRTKYELNMDVMFWDNQLVLARVYLTPFEYACLGLLETVSRIYTASRVNEKVKKGRLMIPKLWGRLAWITYLIALIDFALRNFSMSFYFGLYSVIMTDQDKDVPQMKNVLIVLQVYLAIMRGKFFQFFLRLFLSNYFYEDDDEQFDIKKTSMKQNGTEMIVPGDPDADSSDDEDKKKNDKYAEWFDKADSPETQPLQV